MQTRKTPNTDTFYAAILDFEEDLLAFIFSLESISFIHLIESGLQKRCISSHIWIYVLIQVGKVYRN